ncbi:MAG: PilZ domain-containing protein [Candidatus Aureabacteria bacterium]|nr:PilZ domain-containing protein [Candidatus Auribacterota bacterium]
MEAIIKYYNMLVDLGQRSGLPKESAMAIPIFASLLILAVILRCLIKAFSSGKKSKTASTSSTPLPLKPSSYISHTPFVSAESSSDHRIALRHFDRIEMNLKTTFKTDVNPDIGKSCSVHDVSLSGLSFIAEEKLEKGTRVRLLLPNLDKKSDSKEFIVSGEVVRIKPLDKKEKRIEYGIRFFHLLRRESELLNLVIAKYK